MRRKYRSHALAEIHQTAAALYATGGIDRKTMRKFDLLCLFSIQKKTPKKFTRALN